MDNEGRGRVRNLHIGNAQAGTQPEAEGLCEIKTMKLQQVTNCRAATVPTRSVAVLYLAVAPNISPAPTNCIRPPAPSTQSRKLQPMPAWDHHDEHTPPAKQQLSRAYRSPKDENRVGTRP